MTAAIVLGGGFVGSAVARSLTSRGDVRVLDLPTHPELFDRSPVSRSLVLDACAEIGAQAVVNACGLLRGTPEQLADANAGWPAWVADALIGTGVRFIHIGSASEYGDPGSDTPVDESHPLEPRGDYAVTKASGSRSILASRERGLDATVARVFNIVGPALSPVSPLHQFLTDVTALPSGGGVVELWWPETVRDYVLLDDLGEAIALLALAEASVDVVNVCSGVGISFGEITRAMAAAQGKAVEIRSLDRPGIACVVGEPTRMRDLTGFTPIISAELIAAHAALTPEDG